MDWKELVSKFAPMLGTALGGPLGGAAAEVIANALGLDEKSEAAIKSALAGTTPEQVLALKKADQDFTIKMQELGLSSTKDMEQLAVSDRDSARKREMTVGDSTPRRLAFAITGGFFGILAALLFIDIPSGSKEVLYVMLGSLGTAWAGVTTYYFGSTAGSKVKSELLAKAGPIKE